MTNPTIIVEKNDALIEGESEAYVVDWSAEGTPSAASAKVYVKGESTDLTATLFTGGTGTATISGSLATLPLLTPANGHGGKTYVVVVQATIGTRIRKAQIEIPIVKPQKEG